MARKAVQAGGKTEAALLEAGRALIVEHGFRGLTLRKVAAKAGVNLGMFPYLFGTKEEFVRRVAQSVYEDFFAGFSVETGKSRSPLENLRGGLLSLAKFSRDKRRLALSLVIDASEGDPRARKFAHQNAPRHGMVLIGLIRACQKKGLLIKIPLPMAMVHLMGSVAGPHLMWAVAEAAGLPLPLRLIQAYLKNVLISDKALEKRVDLALRGLRP